MERTLALAALLALGAAPPAAEPVLYSVSGRASQTPCDQTGGWFDPNQRPGLDERKPAPPPLRLLVRAGATNRDLKPVAELSVKQDELYTLQLPIGTYCAVLDDKRVVGLARRPASAGWDARCVLRERQACDAVWKVAGPLDTADLKRVERCPWEERCNPQRPRGPPEMN